MGATGDPQRGYTMNRTLAAFVLALAVEGCGPAPVTLAPSVAGGPAIKTPEAASVAAVRLATIGGPLAIGEIRHGSYGDLWAGVSSDLSGQGAADGVKASLVVWRVDLTGPGGWEEVYVDETTGALVDAITQGS